MGQALRVAIESFRQSPRAADRTIVLLSDGVNTAGLNDPGLNQTLLFAASRAAMSGHSTRWRAPPAQARQNRVRVEG